MADLEPITPDPSLEPVVEPIVPDPALTPDPNVEPPEGELTAEQLRANLTRANSQAAAERVKRQEALDDLEAMRGKFAEMKSIEEVDALISDYQSKLKKSEEATNRLLAAQAAGLPAGFENRISGSTYEELLEDAKSLAPQFVQQTKTPPVPLPPKGGRTPSPPPEEQPGSGYRAAKSKHSH